MMGEKRGERKVSVEFKGLPPEVYRAIIQIVDDRMKEIKVTREDFDRLREKVEETAARHEERFDRLDRALAELAEAQKRTEQVVAGLGVAIEQTRREVGRLSDRFGFTLEDIARVVLPGYLERHLGVRVERLRRRHFTVNGAEYEVDLYGVGQRDGTKVTVLGEVKHRIYAREVKGFVRLLARVMPQIKTEVVKVMFGFLVHPSAEAVAKEEGITLVASYER